MSKLKHAVVSVARFKDKDLRDKYFKVTKSMLIPSLKSQTVQDFDWVVMILEDDVGYAKDYFGMDFIPVFNKPQLVDLFQDGQYTIQTRHDIDDWMAPRYIEEIQRIYKENIDDYDKFLVQAQPVKFNYRDKMEVKMGRYHPTKTSMFLSLCQRECDRHIHEERHGQMWKVAPQVFTLPEGYTKWVIHGYNISCIGRAK